VTRRESPIGAPGVPAGGPAIQRSEIVQPTGWPRPSGYANGVVREGRVLAIAGQIGWDPVTRDLPSDDFASQARRALENVLTVLRAAGAGPEHVVRLTWYVTNRAEYLEALKPVGAAYRALFGGHFPAMSVVIVAGLVEERAKVEIEATAVM
jgi:enamine deaminase RidA (YjgF/YER057c/UK114 family)